MAQHFPPAQPSGQELIQNVVFQYGRVPAMSVERAPKPGHFARLPRVEANYGRGPPGRKVTRCPFQLVAPTDTPT
jgi:hypothetical protein